MIIKKKYVILVLTGLFIYCTVVKAQTYTWRNVAIGGGGFVTGIITSKEQPGLIYARTDVGGAYRWDATDSKWIPLMDWASDQQQGLFGVESIAIDPQSPNIVYMSAGISYFNSGRSYIIRSTDYGANFSIAEVTAQFKVHGNGMGRQNGERLQVDPNTGNILFCGTRRNGLFKSTNSGINWSPAGNIPANITITANDNGICFIAMDKSSAVPGSPTLRMFVGVSRAGNNQNFYRSDDGGASFTAVANASLPASHMPQRAILPGDGNLYITYANGAGPYGTPSEPFDAGQIWKYNIATGAWTNITPSVMNRPFSGISIDPANPMRIVASTSNTYLQQGNVWGDRFFMSTNGGISWTDIIATRGFTLHANGNSWITGQSIHWAGCIEFDPSNTNRVLVTSGNGIFVNEDINTSNTWKFNTKMLEETVPLNLVSIPGGSLISVIGDYDGFLHTDITQYAPIHNPRMGTTSGLDYAALNTNKVVRAGSSIYYSNDMGVTWTKTSTINGSNGQVALSADGGVILHSPNNSAVTYRSVNNGNAWTPVTGLTIASARPVADRVNPNKFYAYSANNDNGSIPNGVVMVSTDGGMSFAQGANAGSWGSKVIRTVPGREGHIWIALYGGGLTRSTNSAASFTKINNVTYCGAVGIGKAAPGSTYETIYIYGTVNGILGVHRSIDEGTSWLRVNDDQHQYGGPGNGQFVVGDMNVFGRVYMSTAGRGIVYGESDVSLPVSLARFNASVHDDIAKLGWTTATETNSSHFEVERSAAATGFIKIGTIPSKAVNGSSSNSLTYSYADDISALSGVIYYRLKQVDKDGKFVYSDVLNVSINKAYKDALHVYPNPASANNINIKVLLTTAQSIIIRIIDMSGFIVYNSPSHQLATGVTSLKVIDANVISGGTYVVEVIDGGSKNVIARKAFIIQ